MASTSPYTAMNKINANVNWVSTSSNGNQSTMKQNQQKIEEYYMVKLDEQQQNYELMAREKEKEMLLFFKQIESENELLKKNIIAIQLELEEEKAKCLNMKETYFNLNSFDETNTDLDKLVYENIKYIKEENEKKLAEISGWHTTQIENYRKEIISLHKTMKQIVETSESKLLSWSTNTINVGVSNTSLNNINNNFDWLESIISSLSYYDTKIKSWLEENYNKDKYAIMWNQKFEWAVEENNFLKNRIMIEKISILDKIEQVQNTGKNRHQEVIAKIQTELEEKKQNYFTKVFVAPINKINESWNNHIKASEQVKQDNEEWKQINAVIEEKLAIVEKEKNELWKKYQTALMQSEQGTTNELFYNSAINNYKNEKEALNRKISELLDKNRKWTEQIEHINTKIEAEIKTINNNNNILINQKNSMLKELKKELDKIANDKTKTTWLIKAQEEEIEKYKTATNEANDRIIAWHNELSKLKSETSKLFQDNKVLNESNKSLNELNENLAKRIQWYQKESKEYENKYNVINLKLNNANNEINNIRQNTSNNNKSWIEYQKQVKDLEQTLTAQMKALNTNQVEIDYLNTIRTNIKQIYQSNFHDNKNDKNEVFMLKEINNKWTQKISIWNTNISIPPNESFTALEASKNSSLYENIIIYIMNMKTQSNWEWFNSLWDYTYTTTGINNNSNSNAYSQIKRNIEDLKDVIEDKYWKYEKRIRSSVAIDDFEKIVIEIKAWYEHIIENLSKKFFKYKQEVVQDNIWIIEIPVDKYNNILNTVTNNCWMIEQEIKNKIVSFRGQNTQMEEAIEILNKYIKNNI